MNLNQPEVLITGFGAFEGVQLNPSGQIAIALSDGEKIAGIELPVSYLRSSNVLNSFFKEYEAPRLLIGLGVHGDSGFRFETQAGTNYIDHPDIDGAIGHHYSSNANSISSSVDLVQLGQAVVNATGCEAYLSTDAGGYLCEWVYRKLLEQAARSDSEALFIHVPPIKLVPLCSQISVIKEVISLAIADRK